MKAEVPSKSYFHPRVSKLNSHSKDSIIQILKKYKNPLILTNSALSESRHPNLINDLSKFQIPIICISSPRGLNDPAQGEIKSVVRQADLVFLIDKEIDFTLGFGRENVFSANAFIVIADQIKTIKHAKKILGKKVILSAKADPKNVISFILSLKSLIIDKSWKSKVQKLVTSRPKEPKKKTTKISPSELCKTVIKMVVM